MLGLATKLETTTTITATVKLSPKARVMLRARCEEHGELSNRIKEIKARQDRLKAEVETLFVKEKQGRALADGAEIAGYKVKMVCGTTRKLDKLTLMKTHGLSQDDLDDCTDSTPNKPYLKITAPGENGKDDQ